MKFEEGEAVLAKKPNSDEFVKAKIVDVKGSKYIVKFWGGVEHSLGESDVRAQRTSRSQTRTKSRTSEKSPGRSASRKSPARKSKSPARPANQSRKLPVRSARQAKISLARIEMPKGDSSDTDRTEGSESLNEFEVPQSGLRGMKITRRSIRIMESDAAKAAREQKLMSLRGMDRAASLPVEKKYNADAKDRGYSLQRDEDLSKNYNDDSETEEFEEKSKKEKTDLSIPQEWGGWFGALLLIFATPVCTLLLQIACSENHCSQKSFRIPRSPKEWKTFLNLEAFLLFTGFLTCVSILSAVPIGKLVDGQQSRIGRLQYRINGLYILLLSIAAFASATYYGYNVGDVLLKKSLPFSVAALVLGTFAAIVLYFKGGRVPVSHLNMYGSTSSRIYNFWQGREISPRFGPVDVKMVLFRFALISTILIDAAALLKIYKESSSFDLNHLHLVAILLAVFQIFYLLDGLVFESRWVNSFEITYEGAGFMLTIGYLIYPYLATLTLRYVLTHKTQPSAYQYACIGLSVLIFFGGYFIYRRSNTQKDEFRKNPFSNSVAHLETIPTKRGKRLLVSGWWGFSRHPNYLGDILMHLSLSVLSYTIYDVLPHTLFIMTLLLLIHRSFRDNARCAKRYGYAWDQYCQRVKYRLLKGVF